MNILGNNAGKLNEVIFENRNKTYGAYDIRSSYNDSLKKSLLCVSGFVILLFSSVFIYNKFNVVKGEEKKIILDDIKLEDLVYTIDMEPLKAPVEQTQPTEAASAAPAGGTPTIVDNASPTATVNTENPINGQGPDNANGTSATSSVVTTNSVETNSAGTNTLASVDNGPVSIAEEMPEFEGGVAGLMRYVSQNVIYPALAREIGKEGTVHVSFVVNEIGMVEGVKILRGIGYGCDEEVVRVINKMPKWKKVGKNQGHPVKVRFNIPVSFHLK